MIHSKFFQKIDYSAHPGFLKVRQKNRYDEERIYRSVQKIDGKVAYLRELTPLSSLPMGVQLLESIHREVGEIREELAQNSPNTKTRDLSEKVLDAAVEWVAEEMDFYGEGRKKRLAEGVLPSSRKPAFADQVAWIRWVRQEAREHPGTLFWIRPHPRLFPNRREGQMSSLGVKLEGERKKPHPANFFWPPEAEQGSVWQHLTDTDVLLNAWSTLGESFGRRGVPVMTFFPGYANSGDRVGWTARTIRATRS